MAETELVRSDEYVGRAVEREAVNTGEGDGPPAESLMA